MINFSKELLLLKRRIIEESPEENFEAEYTVPGTYTLEIPKGGTYLIEAISAGGTGSQWDWNYYWGTTRQFGMKRGSTGAYFKGLINLTQGDHTIFIGEANGDSENGRVSIDSGFSMSGGINAVAGSTEVEAGGSLSISDYIVNDSNNIYNEGFTSNYHYIYQENPAGNEYGIQNAPIPEGSEDLLIYGYGGAGGFPRMSGGWPVSSNSGGSAYLKITRV